MPYIGRTSGKTGNCFCFFALVPRRLNDDDNCQEDYFLRHNTTSMPDACINKSLISRAYNSASPSQIASPKLGIEKRGTCTARHDHDNHQHLAFHSLISAFFLLSSPSGACVEVDFQAFNMIYVKPIL